MLDDRPAGKVWRHKPYRKNGADIPTNNAVSHKSWCAKRRAAFLRRKKRREKLRVSREAILRVRNGSAYQLWKSSGNCAIKYIPGKFEEQPVKAYRPIPKGKVGWLSQITSVKEAIGAYKLPRLSIPDWYVERLDTGRLVSRPQLYPENGTDVWREYPCFDSFIHPDWYTLPTISMVEFKADTFFYWKSFPPKIPVFIEIGKRSTFGVPVTRSVGTVGDSYIIYREPAVRRSAFYEVDWDNEDTHATWSSQTHYTADYQAYPDDTAGYDSDGESFYDEG